MTKFIICADARTGSHMLQTALNSHPEINCFGEIFNPKSIDTMLDIYSPMQALKIIFSHSQKPGGFIIHRHRSDLKSIWNYLAEDKSIKVIFLQRENQVARYASLKKARITKEWINLQREPINDLKVDFVKREFLEEFNKYRINLENTTGLFWNHNILNIYYEDMVNQWRNTISLVESFLNVRQINLDPLTFKQGHHYLDEIFTNPEDITFNQLYITG